MSRPGVYVGVTDYDWYRVLHQSYTRNQGKLEEVNFWRPSDIRQFRSVSPGSLFCFKLKKPKGNQIAGFGKFLSSTQLPASLAWDLFGAQNGATDRASFYERIRQYAKCNLSDIPLREIGCLLIGDPVFLDSHEWIGTPPDFPMNAVQGVSYSLDEPSAQYLIAETMSRNLRLPMREKQDEPSVSMYGTPYLAKARLGQGAFRVLTLKNYQETCCITGETTVPVLQAAHIHPVADGGLHTLSNGLAMRADMHILFDQGLISVDPDLRIRVSQKIRAKYHNGVAYYSHEGKTLRSLPDDEAFHPDRELLKWHLRARFVA